MLDPSFPAASESPAAAPERSFRVMLTPCVITKQFDRCIMVQLGKVDVIDSNGSKRTMEVEGAFSRDGLNSLMADLESVPDPIGLPSQETVKTYSPYMWAVVLNSGEHLQQYPTSGEEVPFQTVHLPEVAQFWIIPRHDPNALPWYGLIRGEGFVRRENLNAPMEPLSLPHPGDVPFEWHYTRPNTLHFVAFGGQVDALPPHVRQVLGWRVGPLGEPDTLIFEIAIEPDGHYQVYKRDPLDHPHWQK